jgi:hypothetical protein
MLNAKTIKTAAKYPLLMVLILQLALTSLFCATAGYAANSIMICTPMGFKTIQLDENGDPTREKSQHAEFQKNCFHCSTGCAGVALLSEASFPLTGHSLITYTQAPQNQAIGIHHSRGPPTRAPPLA